ncbi:MAG: TonB-dependent receptor, partial [Sphingobacteriales bacterium]
YIFLEPGEDILTIRGYFRTFSFRQTDAWLNGADITASYQWNHYLLSTLKGSLLRARDQSRSDWLIGMPADRLTYSMKYTRSLHEHWQEAFAGFDAKYVARQTRIPGHFDDIDFPRPPADYFLLSFSAGVRRIFGTQPVYLAVDVSNLLNVRYRDYLDAFRYFLDQPGTNIALRVRVPFERAKANH